MADSLQRQIRRLEDLSRLQRRFTSDVSHELRTPLTTDPDGGGVPATPAATTSRRSWPARPSCCTTELDRFESLLGDLLEISRYDAGAAHLESEPADIRGVVASAVEAHADARRTARQRGASSSSPTSPVLVDMDARRVERILRNLLGNALDHGEGKPVVITIGYDDDAVAVTVRDHGVGLRPGRGRRWSSTASGAATRPAAGSPAAPVSGWRSRLEDARLHDGWLQAWGERGRGAQFRLTLPRHAGPHADALAAAARPRRGRRGRRLKSTRPKVPPAAAVLAVRRSCCSPGCTGVPADSSPPVIKPVPIAGEQPPAAPGDHPAPGAPPNDARRATSSPRTALEPASSTSAPVVPHAGRAQPLDRHHRHRRQPTTWSELLPTTAVDRRRHGAPGGRHRRPDGRVYTPAAAGRSGVASRRRLSPTRARRSTASTASTILQNGLLLTTASVRAGYNARSPALLLRLATDAPGPGPRWSRLTARRSRGLVALIAQLALGAHRVRLRRRDTLPSRATAPFRMTVSSGSNEGYPTEDRAPRLSARWHADRLNLLAAQVAHTLVPLARGASDEDHRRRHVQSPIPAAQGPISRPTGVTGTPFLAAPNRPRTCTTCATGASTAENGDELSGTGQHGSYFLNSPSR